MVKSLCKGLRTSTPNKCKNVKACKVAKGTKRTFCRKKKNTKRATSVKKTKKHGKRRSEANRLKGLTKKQIAALKILK